MASTVSGANLDDIYDRLNTSPTSHPFDATTVSADWSIEAGDIIKMKRDGEEYDSPLHSNSLTWKGAAEMNLSSGGNESRDSISKQSKNKYSSSNSIYSEQRIYKEFTSSDGMLQSSLLMTASVLRTEFDNELSDVHSSIEQTAEYIITEVHASNSQLYSYVDQTATYIQSVVADVEHDLGSAILQTASQIRSEVHASNSELYSYVDQTATYIQSVVADVENDLGSAILQTASQIRSEVHASNSELYSYVDQTATYIQSVVADVENDLGSAILQTASQIRSEVHASNSELYSYVDQTATYINQEVADTAAGLSSRITQQSNRIGLVVEGTGSDAKVNVAQIVASINDDGTSDALIKADRILLDGNTTVSGMMRVQDGNLFVSGGLTVAEGNEISASQYRVGGSIRFPGAHSSTEDIYLSKSDIQDMIVSASVDDVTNTLTLVSKNGSTITFRKAASGGTKVNGIWSGSTLTVSTGETGRDAYSTTITTGLVTDTTVPGNPTYHITAYRQDNDERRPTELQSARLQYKLGTLAATPTIVRILDSSGTRYINGTASYTIPLTTLNATSNGTYSPSGSNVGYSSVTVNVQSGTENIRTRFSGSSGQYYVEAFDNVSGNPISGSSITYKLARSGLNVQIQDTEGSQISGTASYTIPLQSKSVTSNGTYSADSGYAGLSSVSVSVNPTIGSTFVKDGSTYYVSATKDGNEVSSARKQIALARNGTSVEIQDGHGTARPDTPTYTIPLRTLSATANGDYTPSSSYVGYSSVSVNIKPMLSGRWSGSGTLTVSSDPATDANFVRMLATGTPTWNGTTISIPINATWGSSGQYSESTGWNATADVSGKLTTKSVTANGTYTPDSSYIGFSSITVNVPAPTVTVNSTFIKDGSTYYVSATKDGTEVTSARKQIALVRSGTSVVIQDGQGTTRPNTPSLTIPVTTKSVTANGTYTPGSSYVGFSSVTVNVPAPTVTVNSTFIKDGSKYYVSATKDGTEVTTARKQIALVRSGTSVVIQDGQGSTRANTPSLTIPVTTKSITSNGTYTPGSSYVGFSSVTVSVPTPAPTVNTWGLTYKSAPYTYNATVKVNGTTYTSGALNAVNAYSNGWTGCYNGVGLDSTAAKDLGANESVTVYAQAYSSSSATAKTNKASRTISANAAYEAGWRDGWNAYYTDSPDWRSDYNGNTACVPKACSSSTVSGFDFYNSPYGRGKGNFSDNTSEAWFTYGGGSTPTYSISFYDTGRIASSQINSIISGWNATYITGVKDSAYQQYRYIRFKVDGKYRCFYFS